MTNYIPPITRAKFHLRRRTAKPVTFRFADPHEESVAKEDPQFVDADNLKSISPFYVRKVVEESEDTVINVPKHIGRQTVDIFIQLVSPERANELPTHYLRKAKKQVPGVYDRYSAINAEKIAGSEDTLLDLLLFAQWMEVYWVVDMVIDRLHYLFTEQTRYKEIFAVMGTPTKGSVNVGGRQVFVGSQLPSVDNQLVGIAAEDFDDDFMSHLAKLSVGSHVWRFVADMTYALRDKVEDAGWLATVLEEVQQIFLHTEEKYLDAAATREEFCARYHHHPSDSDACYTSRSVHPATHVIDILYASTAQEPVHLSDGLASASGLVNNPYSSADDVSDLKNDSSTRVMLEAEKMVLEMESRLHETKGTIWRARIASEEEKRAATDEASRFAGTMYSHVHYSTKRLQDPSR
jgi:hypothetical protein